VSVIEPTGADTYVVVRTAAGDVTVRLAPQTPVRLGQAVGLTVVPQSVSWFDVTSGQRLGA
jgi:multiple sugar transport system ATP-binding protein